MSTNIQFVLAAITMTAIYLAVLCKLLLVKAWPLRAGIALSAISLLPVLWALTFPENEFDTPGAGFIMVLVVGPFLALALLILAIGSVLAAVRGLRAALLKHRGRAGQGS